VILNATENPIVDNVVSTNTTDCSANDGTITITASSGTGSFEYSIDNGSTWQSSNSFTGLAVGNYTILVRNDNGTCPVSYTSNPAIINAPASPSISNVVSTDVTDCTLSDGSITITATGGTGSFEYSIDSGTTWQTSNIFSNLIAGNYNLVVRNNDNTCPVFYGSNPL
jgi:hypothetical protein